MTALFIIAASAALMFLVFALCRAAGMDDRERETEEEEKDE